MGIFDRLFGSKKPGSPSDPPSPRSPHYRWVLERIAENESGPAAQTQRRVQELVDALRSLQGSSSIGVFGLSTGSLAIGDEEKRNLQERIGAALRVNRDGFERAGDVVSLLELSKVADLCNLPALRLTKRAPLRCDPLGDSSALSNEWQSLIARLRRVRDEPTALRWDRATAVFDDDPPSEVILEDPESNSLYEFALRYEQENKQEFSRELAAVWSVVGCILLTDSWYLAPVAEWSWEDEGLQVGRGQSVQGRLCLSSKDDSQNLADAEVLDLDDDGAVIRAYPNFLTLMDLLVP